MNSPENLKRLLAAGLHFGHKSEKWNPKMKQYLFGVKNGIHIFDLEKTAQKLEEALRFLSKCASEGKVIMLVSTKQQTKETLPDLAIALGLPYVTERWFGGLLTNWQTTKERIKQLRNLKKERDETAFGRYLKKERNKKMKQIEKLEQWLSGIEKLEKKPDVVFVLDTVRDNIAVREARKCKISVVGMVDSNSDPDLVDYPIPGNDDATKAIALILSEIGNAIENGQKNPVKPAEKKVKKEETPAEATEKQKSVE